MQNIAPRTLVADELAADLNVLRADNDDLLALEKLLGHDRGKTTKEVTLGVDDNSLTQHTYISKKFSTASLLEPPPPKRQETEGRRRKRPLQINPFTPIPKSSIVALLSMQYFQSSYGKRPPSSPLYFCIWRVCWEGGGGGLLRLPFPFPFSLCEVKGKEGKKYVSRRVLPHHQKKITRSLPPPPVPPPQV